MIAVVPVFSGYCRLLMRLRLSCDVSVDAAMIVTGPALPRGAV